MISFSNQELADAPSAYIGQEINCPHCGRTHILVGGVDKDGKETDTLLFYKCFSGTPYLGAVNGRLIHFITPCPIDSTHHRKRVDEVCPICKVYQAWEHIPYLEGATWENYDNPMLACWGCFRRVWKGEV